MKILMINVVCGIRSTGRICTDLAAALEAQGHEVKIAYGREEVPEQFQKYAVRIGTNLDFKLHGLKARLFDACGFGSKQATINFLEWVDEFKPDVIHLHNIHGYYINIEVLFNYLKNCGKKIIWTLHDCWAFTGHTAYCDVYKCTKWEKGCFSCSGRKAYPASYIDKSKKNWKIKRALMTQIPDITIVTPSEWLAGMVRKSFLKKYQIKVVHNGIDTTIFHQVESDFKNKYDLDGKMMLLAVSTAWDKMKGLNDYIKLSSILGSDYRFVIVGLSKKQIKSIPNLIIGLERTNSIEELTKLYSAADLYVNLSYCENYPTVNLEAMACGTPVLTYNTGGSAESVWKNNGIVVRQGDIETVACSIKKYWESKVKQGKTKLDFNYMVQDKNEVAEEYLKLILN